MTPWVNLGYQWDCEKSDQDGLCDQASDSDLSNHMGDGYENPDRRGRLFGAARRHARRTGHKVIVDRHSRFTIEADSEGSR